MKPGEKVSPSLFDPRYLHFPSVPLASPEFVLCIANEEAGVGEKARSDGNFSSPLYSGLPVSARRVIIIELPTVSTPRPFSQSAMNIYVHIYWNLNSPPRR